MPKGNECFVKVLPPPSPDSFSPLGSHMAVFDFLSSELPHFVVRSLLESELTERNFCHLVLGSLSMKMTNKNDY